jgi:hypothetical protein
MNKSLLIALLFVATSVQAVASSVEETVKTIRARYSEIERGLKDCRQVKRDLPDESAEGGELTAWFKGPSLQKLSARFFGESGKALEEYYFLGDQLVFVLRVESRYTKPMSGVVKTKTEERFYFADAKLIRWLGDGNKPVPLGPESDKRERELSESAAKYKAIASQ